jgi:hypothetical protein
MASLVRMPASAALVEAGLFNDLTPMVERFDRRAFTVVQNRDEAEYLLALDHSKAGNDTEWAAYFVESLVEFLVWQNQPCGRIAESDVDWLVGMIADAPSSSVPALLFALVRELNDVPQRLMALALKHAKDRLIALR